MHYWLAQCQQLLENACSRVRSCLSSDSLLLSPDIKWASTPSFAVMHRDIVPCKSVSRIIQVMQKNWKSVIWSSVPSACVLNCSVTVAPTDMISPRMESLKVMQILVLACLLVFQSSVYAVKYSPFLSDVFLSCSADWTVRLWHTDRQKCYLTMATHSVRHLYISDVPNPSSDSCVWKGFRSLTILLNLIYND